MTIPPSPFPADAAEVAWDIETLLEQPGAAGVAQLLDEAEQLSDEVAQTRGTIETLGVSELASVFNTIAEITDRVGRAGNYASLAFCVETSSPEVGALMQSVQERSTQIAAKLLFVELEWSAVSDEHADTYCADPELGFVARHLRNIRRYRPHLLSEPEEVLMMEKSVTGAAAWSRLFDEITSAIEVDIDGKAQPLDSALAHLHNRDSTVRSGAAAAVTQALEPSMRTRAFVFNTLLADKATDDRFRKYPTWLSARNLDNEASDASVDALIAAVVARYDIARNWYRTKAQLMGVEQLNDWDRYASLAQHDAECSWGEACQLVYDAYASFSPKMASIVEKFLTQPWIDAPVRESKRGGAFCAYTVASHHPYLLLNWTSKRRDVLTLAHELGHGVHAYLSRPQGDFHQMTPLTVAETASVFGETVTFNTLLAQVEDPAERLPLLASCLEDQIATVFRQVAMSQFEQLVHTERREVGELSIERFGDLWIETQSAMLGDSVKLSDGYRSWWSYLPHFIHTPGYVYAYAYGQLLALSVYAHYEQQGSDFVASYEEMLAAGGSRSPEELGAMVGVDLTDPAFWDGGLDIIQRLLEQTQRAADLLS